jgi:peptidoglycan/xylan/chitin deacetylase (PgdA/CDA1 family)
MLILCYHELADDEASPWVLRPETFAQHLEILLDRGFRFDALPREAGHSPHEDKRVVITFDDGTIGCLRHAQPILARHGIRAWFYICPGYTNGVVRPYHPTSYMSWAQIRELAQHHEIGAHSLTHCVFDQLPPEQRLRELIGSKIVLEDRLGRPCPDFATPYGYVDDHLKALARRVGFSTLVTTEQGRNRDVEPYRLERWEVRSPSTAEEFARKLEELETLP